MLVFWNLFLFLLSIHVYQSKAGTFSVDYSGRQYLKDGKPFRYISGEIHYFRIHPDLWEDRLQRIKAAGLNAIQSYVPWNMHEPMPGTFDFSGGLNFTRFFTLAQQIGLNVLLRAGPYICAEWENGGLPWWLLKYEGVRLRHYETNYINAVKNYFNVLMPTVKPLLYQNGGPILMVQIENEYGNYACDHEYTAFLRDYTIGLLGNDAVLYTTDNHRINSVACGAVPGVFTTVDFAPVPDSDIDGFFANQQNYSHGGPYVCSEFYPGWFVTWDQTNGYPHRPTFIDNLKYMYSKGASYSIYMFHGGTNFGFQNGEESTAGVITSYDYNAPISENGDITPLYKEIRSFIENLSDWVQPPLDVPANNPASNYGQVQLARIGNGLLSTLTQLQEPCTSSLNPSTFEQINHGYGFVLYTTTLTKGGKILTTPNIRDYGYVFVNNVFQGMLNREQPVSIGISAQSGDVLRILVENRGRITATEIDPKGLHANVTLDGAVLQNWYQCGINLTKESVDSLSKYFDRIKKQEISPDKAVSLPGVYVGEFDASVIQDTFFDSIGWTKGQLFINGYNLGRYWNVGPQITLYVPKPYIQSKNTVLLIELVGGGSNQTSANFIDHAVFNFH